MKHAMYMDKITMEYVDFEGEINERVIDSKNLHFFRVDNSPANQMWIWKILSPLYVKKATGTEDEMCISHKAEEQRTVFSWLLMFDLIHIFDKNLTQSVITLIGTFP